MNKQNKRPNCLLKEIYMERENKMKKIKATKIQGSK